MAATASAKESDRLRAISALEILDTPSEPEFDNIVALVASFMETPIALITIVDRDRQWFKANYGLTWLQVTPRDVSFCARAILEPETMVVADASRDARFADNPLVTGPPGIRFYAGAPLITAAGHALGTLCAIDRKAGSANVRQLGQLRHLAGVVTALIEARADRARLSAARAAIVRREQQMRTITDAVSAMIAYVAPDERLLFVNRPFERWVGRSNDEIIGRRAPDILPNGAWPELQPMFARVLLGETVTCEMASHRHLLRTLQLTGTPDFGPGGVQGAFVVVTDITARVQSEHQRERDQLRDLNNRLREELELERRRIARTLHDECGQELTAVRLRLATLAIAGAEFPAIAPLVADVDAALAQAARAMRALVGGLRPPLLDDLGLMAAIRNLARRVESQSGVAVDVTVAGEVEGLPDETSLALYRVLQEALTNVQRYAKATEVSVELRADANSVRLAVLDNGRGFDPSRVERGSFGLIGMRERALELGGSALIDSRPGAGTRVVVELPANRA